jgi:hypothetical protein
MVAVAIEIEPVREKVRLFGLRLAHARSPSSRLGHRSGSYDSACRALGTKSGALVIYGRVDDL